MFQSLRSRVLWGLLLALSLRLFAILIIPPGGDEVAQLYMADDIAHFTRFPIYFDQQAAMGTLESYFLAPLLRLFGFSYLAARLGYSLFYFTFMGIYLWIVKRLFSRELTAYLFILLAVLPFPALFFTTVIGWAEIPFLAIVSLALLLAMTKKLKRSLGPSFALGFVCGIAIWCNPLFVIWMVPIGISVVWLIPQSGARKIPWGALLGLLVGLFPVWIHGLETGILMGIEDNAKRGLANVEDVPRIFYLFFARMKYFLSTFSFGSTSPWIDTLIRGLSLFPFLIFWVSFGSFVFYVFRSRKIQKPKEKVFSYFVIFPPFVLMILYCSGNFLLKDEGMRFLLQLVIPYVFVVSWQLQRLPSKVWKKGLLSLLVGGFLAGTLFSGREMIRRGSEFRELIRFLEKERLYFGIANVGTAYPLNILSGHRVVATPLPHHAISNSIWGRVKAGGPRFLILERQNPQLRKELESDPNLKKAAVGSYDVFYGESAYLVSLLDVQEPILY